MIDFVPYGYDERQYCSPGINLPVGCLMRGRHGEFPQYHTSADNLDFVTTVSLEDSFLKCLAAFEILEGNQVFMNRKPKGEPQLGRRSLYDARGAGGEGATARLLWVLNLSDGKHSLLDIAERANLPFGVIQRQRKPWRPPTFLPSKNRGDEETGGKDTIQVTAP